MIKKVLEIVDVRKLANAIYNNKPDVVKGILEPVPDHLSLYLTYLGIPLHPIPKFVNDRNIPSFMRLSEITIEN